VSERRRDTRDRRRVERALERDLSERRDIGPGERAALRAQAHAVDLAETACDPELITVANRGYLELRESAGLTAGQAKAPDTLEALFAELAKPSTSDTADT
jgi:hypothetical protein